MANPRLLKMAGFQLIIHGWFWVIGDNWPNRLRVIDGHPLNRQSAEGVGSVRRQMALLTGKVEQRSARPEDEHDSFASHQTFLGVRMPVRRDLSCTEITHEFLSHGLSESIRAKPAVGTGRVGTQIPNSSAVAAHRCRGRPPHLLMVVEPLLDQILQLDGPEG